ncbi:hypothetical protein GGU10DRAFT_394251 [Lentinula aff. detonsa]|uniref:XLF-like N-terminal domain-containing protein n=1 Tax=Lentinula aff. detonsa TaxID=2804958 RepID=A0AA38NPW4_9AGAR|nr:hypothetical protein GGU10DRAFT_394251 [Lentinula aff. detonsa]
MEQISEARFRFNLDVEQSKLLASKEWLVKVDSQKSTPYLFKFHSSKIDLTCTVMITDTKSVWAEALTGNQIARRWRACNKVDPFVPNSAEEDEKEEEWRLSILRNLSEIHTPGGMDNVSFEVVESRSSDFAFEIDCEAFKWTWETCFIGYKSSTEIISKHLVLPLLSVTHTVLSVVKPAGEMLESELEKAIDGVGRAARRSIDTHIKNVISKPRMNTSIRRMTALYNLCDHLPPISFTNEEPKLQIATPPRLRAPDHPPFPTKAPSSPSPSLGRSSVPRELYANAPKQNSTDDSATESDDDELGAKVTPVAAASASSIPGSPSQQSGFSQSSRPPAKPTTILKAPPPDSDSSPPRPPTKKKKETVTSSSEDSEERRKRVAKLKSRTASARGGVRQPLKRGGKRF